MKQVPIFGGKVKYVVVILLFVFQLSLILFFQRGVFFQKYDVGYWKDRFEHSQWQLPLSHRILGDDGLFAYVGYTLIHGADPSLVNAETPPVAKYFLGTSILLFQNPLVYTGIIGIATLIVFFFLAKRLLQDTTAAALCAFFLLLDPLFFSQLSGGWVDSTQIFFLLLHFLLLFSLPKKKMWQYIFILFSGILLGIFAESKTPIVLPIIILIDGVYIFRYSLISVILFLIGFGIGDLLPYIYYFQLHHSLLDFIRLQKYIISFYTKSRLSVNHESLWIVVLLGKFPDIVSGAWGFVREWWVFWPLALILGLFISIKSFFFKDDAWVRMFGVFVIFSLILFSFIPFYPRYLLLVIPFFYLLAAKVLITLSFKRVIHVLIFIAIIYGSVNSFFYLHQNPKNVLDGFSYNISHGYFQDIYQEDITNNSQRDTHMNREQFFKILHIVLGQGEIHAISVTMHPFTTNFFATQVTVPLTITYDTEHIGSFNQQKQVKLIKQHGLWKVVWDWNIFLDGFTPGDTLQTKVINGKRGTIKTTTGKVLAEDTDGVYAYKISVVPKDITNEQAMLKFFYQISGIKAVYLQNAYLENALPDETVDLFTTVRPITDKEFQKLDTFSFIAEPAETRLYYDYPPTAVVNTVYEECCTRLYSSSNYHGVLGFEKKYDSLLQGEDGGVLLLRNSTGIVLKTIIQREAKNGQDVIVSL
jgi:hypothetical protein